MKKTASIKVKIPTESENYLRLTTPSRKEVHRCVRQAGITGLSGQSGRTKRIYFSEWLS